MSVAESSMSASRALDDLYRNHVSEVYRYAYAVLGNHADAEDVTQTTFVNALRALERGERPRKPSNWLITITHNIVRQRFRQQQARPIEVFLDRDVAQETSDDAGMSMDELVRALQRIPQSQREALVMRELEGRPYSEIAEILGLSTGALETLLFRARRSLADELENLVTCDGAALSLSRQLDGRLSRKERKRLDDHMAECPSCALLQTTQSRQRRAFKGLALLPLPLSLTLFKGVPSASAAIGLPTIGAAGTAAVVGGSSAAAAGGGATIGGLALGGVALKAAAVVAAVSVASGVGYVGTKEVESHLGPAHKTPASAVRPVKARPATIVRAQHSRPATSKGNALARGATRATAPTGPTRGASAPGRSHTSTRAATATTGRKAGTGKSVSPTASSRSSRAKPAAARAAATATPVDSLRSGTSTKRAVGPTRPARKPRHVATKAVAPAPLDTVPSYGTSGAPGNGAAAAKSP